MSRFLIIAYLISIVGLSCISTAAESSGALLLFEDFDSYEQDDFGTQALLHELISLAKGAGPDGSDAIRVSYVGYERGSKRVVIRFPLKEQVKEATLSYDVCFEEDFQWVLGGKLHGLGPEAPITGGNPRKPGGWSARITFKPDGHCATYLYDQQLEITYGIGDKSIDPVFRKGQWHHVVLEVRLNDPGKSNGQARILIDGKEVVNTGSVEFRGEDGPHTAIQKLLFSTFHGGHQPKNAPVDKDGNTVTVHAMFDNFKVVTPLE